MVPEVAAQQDGNMAATAGNDAFAKARYSREVQVMVAKCIRRDTMDEPSVLLDIAAGLEDGSLTICNLE
jgi:hypothetical protein